MVVSGLLFETGAVGPGNAEVIGWTSILWFRHGSCLRLFHWLLACQKAIVKSSEHAIDDGVIIAAISFDWCCPVRSSMDLSWSLLKGTLAASKSPPEMTHAGHRGGNGVGEIDIGDGHVTGITDDAVGFA